MAPSIRRTSAGKKEWVRSRPLSSDSERPAPTSTMQGILAKGAEHRAELLQRAEQVNQLCALASTVRALGIKIQTKKFQAKDFEDVKPPQIHMTNRGGCSDGVEFIGDVLHETKSLLIELCQENLRLGRENMEFNTLIQTHSSILDDGGFAPAHADLNGPSLVEFTSRLTIGDDE